uniref:hypothetical protein n=1 Tax=Thaumasiovibrio occultus TaxID=1891184 RepID=UPI00131B9C3D|nr:hypothetical protein [Thaumasiovibrio occultus]
MKLAVVIHAEEEFNWRSGFSRKNTKVSDCETLVHVIDSLTAAGAKVTLAMDFPFVTSDRGRAAIRYLRVQHENNIEFAAHLHPWVSPPFDNTIDEEHAKYSFPGNLPAELEYQKIRLLKQTIESECQREVVTYLAGRYGLGEATSGNLSRLGFKVDLSICPFRDYSHLGGPNFQGYDNRVFTRNGITHIPHTSGLFSSMPWVGAYLNENPAVYRRICQSTSFRSAIRLLQLDVRRLSPEGANFQQMCDTVRALRHAGQDHFVMSFHSSSLVAGSTPYTATPSDVDTMVSDILAFGHWFMVEQQGQAFLPQQLVGSSEIITADQLGVVL